MDHVNKLEIAFFCVKLAMFFDERGLYWGARTRCGREEESNSHWVLLRRRRCSRRCQRICATFDETLEPLTRCLRIPGLKIAQFNKGKPFFRCGFALSALEMWLQWKLNPSWPNYGAKSNTFLFLDPIFTLKMIRFLKWKCGQNTKNFS